MADETKDPVEPTDGAPGDETPAADAAAEESAPEQPKMASPEVLKPGRPKPRVSNTDEEEKTWDRVRMRRRDFTYHSTAAFLTLCLFATMRFFFPRTLFEPKTKFKIGYPTDYEIGVDTRHQASKRIWVVKRPSEMFVILAKCTHLGCTPDWKESENKFKCPCHGSGFTSAGINFEGPAPRPLDRCAMVLAPDGQIEVDKLKVYQFDQFGAPGSSLTV